MEWRLIIQAGRVYFIAINIIDPVFLFNCHGYIPPLIGFFRSKLCDRRIRHYFEFSILYMYSLFTMHLQKGYI